MRRYIQIPVLAFSNLWFNQSRCIVAFSLKCHNDRRQHFIIGNVSVAVLFHICGLRKFYWLDFQRTFTGTGRAEFAALLLKLYIWCTALHCIDYTHNLAFVNLHSYIAGRSCNLNQGIQWSKWAYS